MSFLRQFSVICVHMHISEWYYARGVGLHFYAAVFTPPSRLHSFHPVLGQHLCSHSSHINPVCWGPSPAPPPLSSPEPPPLHHPVSQLILVSVMGHIWHRSKACSRHIPLRVETTRLFLTVKSQEEWMFACMFLMICLWAYLLAFWAIPPSVPCIPPLSQQPFFLVYTLETLQWSWIIRGGTEGGFLDAPRNPMQYILCIILTHHHIHALTPLSVLLLISLFLQIQTEVTTLWCVCLHLCGFL